MEDILIVDDLIKELQKLQSNGCGDMKIKCSDNYIHKDEIGFNYLTREVVFRGNIYNFSMTKRIQKFCDDIKKAEQTFYHGEEFLTDGGDSDVD